MPATVSRSAKNHLALSTEEAIENLYRAVACAFTAGPKTLFGTVADLYREGAWKNVEEALCQAGVDLAIIAYQNSGVICRSDSSLPKSYQSHCLTVVAPKRDRALFAARKKTQQNVMNMEKLPAEKVGNMGTLTTGDVGCYQSRA